MNAFTAHDLEAEDLLALARLDDDGAPPAVTPAQASDGQGRHARRLARTGQVSASRAEMIAAARRQRGPTGIGRIRTGLIAAAGRTPDHTAAPDHAPNPPAPLAPARDQAHSAARTTPRSHHGRPGKSPVPPVSGRKEAAT